MGVMINFVAHRKKRVIQKTIPHLEQLLMGVKKSLDILEPFCHYRSIKQKWFELKDIESDIENSITRKRLRIQELELEIGQDRS